MLSSLGATAAQPAPADLKKKASLGPNSTPLVKVQKTPVFIDDVTLAHLSHLFLGVPGGKVPGHFDTATHHSVQTCKRIGAFLLKSQVPQHSAASRVHT